MRIDFSGKPAYTHRLPHLPLNRVPQLRDGFIVAKVGWAAILFTLLPPLKAQHPLQLTASATSSATLLHLDQHRIPLKRDNTVVRPTPAPALKLIAELPGKALLLTDTYPSRPGGLSFCQAGEEQFLRLITLLPRPRETLHLKLASCRDGLELAENGLHWSPATQILTIHWLTPPPGQTNPRILHVASNGRLAQ